MKKITYMLLFFGWLILPLVAHAQTEEMVRIYSEQQIAEAQQRGEMFQNRANGAMAGLGTMLDVLKTIQSGSEFYNSLPALDPGECIPSFETNPADMMPSGCMEASECASCYQSAISRISTVRKSLARMSCIYSNTKTFTESAIAFGDDVSGIHGAMGLAWHAERKGIVDAFEKLKKTYDKKYLELIASLQTGLREIDACERQFGMKDWYQKAGFIYMEMMKEKYRRTD